VLSPVTHRDGGRPQAALGVQQWTEGRFRIESDDRVPAGIDGEAVVLESPLRFRSMPSALRVRIAPGHPGASPSAGVPDSLSDGFVGLMKLALGLS
jgi:hypothetical protein